MSDTTKIIKTTIGNVIFAFSIGTPLTILTFWAVGYPRELNPYLVPILFGGIWLLCDYFKVGSLTLFIYIFYTFLFVRNKYYGSIAILCIHNTPLAIVALFVNHSHGVPQSQSFFQLMNPVHNLYALPTILLYVTYNIFLLFHIFRNFYAQFDSGSNVAIIGYTIIVTT
jgi:hypothetical protein